MECCCDGVFVLLLIDVCWLLLCWYDGVLYGFWEYIEMNVVCVGLVGWCVCVWMIVSVCECCWLMKWIFVMFGYRYCLWVECIGVYVWIVWCDWLDGLCWFVDYWDNGCCVLCGWGSNWEDDLVLNFVLCWKVLDECWW